jgi:tripartite-type tricarboxylate transporter receptor subunit TctC
MTRLVAHKLEQALGQSVVVENRPGGSGVIALNAAAKAAPDGYTLVTVPGPVLTNLPLPRLGKQLTGVAMLGKGPMILVGTAGPAAPADLKALIASAKAAPGKYSFASSGNGTSQHLAGELMDQMAGIKMTHVPYKGGNQAVTDVIGGQIPLAMLGIPPVLAHVKSGKLKAYGVTTTKRSPALPDVPTMAEAGLPGFEASQWFVVAAPTGVPADRVQKLNAAIGTILKQPDIVKAFENMGVDPAVESPRQTTDYVAADLKRWRALARKSNLALD